MSDQEVVEFVGSTLTRRFVRLPGSVDEPIMMFDYKSLSRIRPRWRYISVVRSTMQWFASLRAPDQPTVASITEVMSSVAMFSAMNEPLPSCSTAPRQGLIPIVGGAGAFKVLFFKRDRRVEVWVGSPIPAAVRTAELGPNDVSDPVRKFRLSVVGQRVKRAFDDFVVSWRRART